MNIQTAKLVIEASALANDTVIMEGLHGIGKSNIVQQYARENDGHIEELFLSMMDVGDLMGMPRTKQVGNTTITTWAEPDWFQRITDASWPQTFEFDDLEFSDPEFKEYCKKCLDII